VLTKPKKIITDFSIILKQRYHINFDSGDITHELWKAPVKISELNLKSNKGAVYVFSLTERSKAPAGPNRVLKVGMVGPKSIARFRHQHYKPGSANSTLAGTIRSFKILWDYIGISEGSKQQIDFGQWLIDYTDRDHFFMPKTVLKTDLDDILGIDLLCTFEYYLKGIFGPVFEG
jgi:hypothetical protein